MTRTSLQNFNCSFARTADLIGDKWALLVLRDAFYGYTQFSDFKERLGITPAVLSTRLQSLVSEGILERVQVREGVDRHGYHLTERGMDLFPVVLALVQWGDKWIFDEEGPPIILKNKSTNVPIKPLEIEDGDGVKVLPRDLTFDAGPGATEETRAIIEEAKSRRPH